MFYWSDRADPANDRYYWSDKTIISSTSGIEDQKDRINNSDRTKKVEYCFWNLYKNVLLCDVNHKYW